MIAWFVSHYWGMPVRHFADAVCKHAQLCQQDLEESSYWICTFSNNQMRVQEELGEGHWQSSSFYLALSGPECKGTAMIIDELVLPLQRIWCLFEVCQTICLSREDHFQGLLLCASTDVLQEGQAGTDISIAVAEHVEQLDIRAAQATSEEDRMMIHALIEDMPGGFDTMKSFVRHTICKALEASHQNYESTLKDLLQKLSSVESSGSFPLPTLLGNAKQSHPPNAKHKLSM